MSRTVFVWIILAAFGSGAALTVASVWTRSVTGSGEQPPVVFVCRESGQIFVGHAPSVPQIHPDSGRATLWPGLYCPNCEKWTPAPPMEKLYGKPEMLHCPACRTPRAFEGELPDDALEL